MLLQYSFRFQRSNNIPIFRVKSDWDPPEYSYPPLQKYFGHVLKDVTNFNKHPTHNTNNMSDIDIRASAHYKNFNNTRTLSSSQLTKVGKPSLAC